MQRARWTAVCRNAMAKERLRKIVDRVETRGATTTQKIKPICFKGPDSFEKAETFMSALMT